MIKSQHADQSEAHCFCVVHHQIVLIDVHHFLMSFFDR